MLWSKGLKPGEVMFEENGHLMWEVHGTERRAEHPVTRNRWRINQVGDYYILYEILKEESVPVLKDKSLDFCKGFASGLEGAMFMVASMGVFAKLRRMIGGKS